jgi:glutamyl-Q tRNA(Asp) synthetase
MMYPPVFRFAPSPNGFLHLGHALSALLNADLARNHGGRLLLRIEDIDRTRCRPDYEQAIYEDLAWLGIAWEAPVRRQSEHFNAYRDALAVLQAQDLVYPSFESRGDIAALVTARGDHWPQDPDGAPLYPGSRRAMSDAERQTRMDAGEPYALRLGMQCGSGMDSALDWGGIGEAPGGAAGVISAEPRAWGDVILARKDMPTSYHLSVVVDDALQGITDVVRGQDLFWSTSVHRLLQALLGLRQPVYRHHRLIRDQTRRKLSKSTQATALRALRTGGATPADIRRMVGLPEP